MARAFVVGLFLAASSTALASENPRAFVPSVAVEAGGVAGLAPGRTAPSLELSAAVGPSHGRWSVTALFDGWTLDATATSAPTTELVGGVGPSWRLPVGDAFWWTVAAAPAVAWSDAATVPSSWHFGVVVAPGLEVATRRATLTLDLGGRAMFFTDGPRFALVAGARYAFR